MRLLFLMILVILYPPLVLSQEKTTLVAKEKWYQIELFIYGNNDNLAHEHELWEQYPTLRYPINSQLLSPLPEQEIIPSSTLEYRSQQSLSSTLAPKQQQPFALLEKDQLQLNNAVRRVLRQADFRALFHGAWRQIIPNRDEAISIVITGGDRFDNHFELEGTITLGVNRYLHIETDLWLSAFSNKGGLKETTWQALPERPLPVEALEDNPIDYSSALDRSVNFESDSLQGPVSKSAGNINSNIYNTGVTATQANNVAVRNGTKTEFTAGMDVRNEHSRSTVPKLRNNPGGTLQPQEALRRLLGNLYSVESIAVLRQKRKMRSNELHYIDHPSMGLLIKITPYQLPDPQLEQGQSE